MTVRRHQSRSRIACLSAATAAVAALSLAAMQAHARDLVWDSDGAAGVLGQDGDGPWNETDPNWVYNDGVNPASNVVWDSTIPDNATFGNTTTASISGVTNTVSIASNVTVGNWTIGTGANGGRYNFNDGGGQLTLAGNFTKATGFGAPQMLSLFNPMLNLAAGQHVFAINDTGGDAAPEMTFNTEITGPGGVTLNNGTFVTWGTMAFDFPNSYTGPTNIDKGRLVIADNNALGATSSGTTIGALGTLSIGGAGQTNPVGGLNLNIGEPITITRDTYTQPESTYGYALIAQNGTGTHTLSGGLIVDSTDARISVNTSRLIIPGAITQGPTIGPAGLGKVSFVGDFAGFVELQGDNSALLGGFEFRNAVEVQANSQANIGGPNSKLSFTGDATLGIMNGFMTDFGTHVVNYDSFAGGLDIPTGQTFNLTQAITGGVGMGKRGGGTLNFNAPVTHTTGVGNAGVFWDAGVVNINANQTLGAIHLRTVTVNIADGVTFQTNSGFSSLGQDGTDSATVNILGGGTFFANTGQDFNVSDNAGTSARINIPGNGTLTVNGSFFMSKNNGTTALIDQDGGVVNANRTGGQSFVLGQGTGSNGTFDKSAGALNIAGEMWVGNNNGGNGTFIQSGGTTSVANWIAIGRVGNGPTGSKGEVTISGGTFTRTATNIGSRNYVGEGTHTDSVLNINGSGTMTINGGQFWLGNAGSSRGTMNISGNGVFSMTTGTANNNAGENWIAVGRNGTAQGILNLSGNGTLNSSATYNLAANTGTSFVIGSGGTASGTFTQTGGTVNAQSMAVGETGTGIYNVSAGNSNILANLAVGQAGGGNGTFNISGTANVLTGPIEIGHLGTSQGVINLDGGTLTAASIKGGASTSTNKTLNLNGGTLKPSADNATFIGSLSAANIKNGGAIIDTNGFNVTSTQSLVGGVSTGGLTKNGAGTLALAGAANVYTGATTVNAGTLAVADTGSKNNVIKGGALTIAPAARLDLKNNKLITTTAEGTATAGIYNGVQGQVQRASNGGTWDQPGLTTSLPDAAGGLTSIGVATGAQIRGLGPTDTDTFAGQTINGNSTIAMYTYAGDANLDGAITGDDYSAIDFNILVPGADGWYNGDFNYDGAITGDDYSAIDFNILAQGAPFPTSGSLASASGLSGVTAVPEPASISLVALGATALLRRRRRTQRLN
jgi:autotransporter-associated beta strand protein